MGARIYTQQDFSTFINETITNTSSARYGDDVVGSTIGRDTITINSTESKELVSALSAANSRFADVSNSLLNLTGKAVDAVQSSGSMFAELQAGTVAASNSQVDSLSGEIGETIKKASPLILALVAVLALFALKGGK